MPAVTRRAAVVACIFCPLLSVSLRAQQDSGDLLAEIEAAQVRVIRDTEAAVVAIARVRPEVRRDVSPSGLPGFSARSRNPFDNEFVPDDFGSGVIIPTEQARHPLVILTNYHVVRGGPVLGQDADETRPRLIVSVRDRGRFAATIIAADPHSDLAVLSVDPQLLADGAAGLTALRPTAVEPQKGQFVFAMGNPWAIARDGSASVSWGIISNLLRHPIPTQPDDANNFRLFETVHQFGTLMQIGVALPMGTSGGAVIDRKGRLIGLSTSLAPLRGYEQSAGYAVPFTAGILRVIDQLTRGYEVEYGFLGVRPDDAAREDFQGLMAENVPPGGAVVTSITGNSPAMEAGLEADDVVVSIDGKPVRDGLDLMREIALAGPGGRTRMRYWRPSEKKFRSCNARLAKWPVRNDSDMIVTAHRFPEWRGLRVDFPTARARYLRRAGNIQFEAAVLIVSVDESRNGVEIQAGDFISHVGETPVGTPREFHLAVRKLGENQPVPLRTAGGRTIEIKP